METIEAVAVEEKANIMKNIAEAMKAAGDNRDIISYRFRMETDKRAETYDEKSHDTHAADTLQRSSG
jgi:uncharacterized protein YqgV (UPF0045/DUF77 family)